MVDLRLRWLLQRPGQLLGQVWPLLSASSEDDQNAGGLGCCDGEFGGWWWGFEGVDTVVLGGGDVLFIVRVCVSAEDARLIVTRLNRSMFCFWNLSLPGVSCWVGMLIIATLPGRYPRLRCNS